MPCAPKLQQMPVDSTMWSVDWNGVWTTRQSVLGIRVIPLSPQLPPFKPKRLYRQMHVIKITIPILIVIIRKDNGINANMKLNAFVKIV